MIEANPFDEAVRVLDSAEAAGADLRVTGGVAIGLRCPSAREEPLARGYNDVDFIVPRRQTGIVEGLFRGLGYEPENEFNALHGESRMFFLDRQNGREADVFVNGIRGCHELDLGQRITAVPRTLAPADLLLSKLQVRETNRKDHLDIFALLVDCPFSDDDSGINRGRLVAVCCGDWGWWRTVTSVAAGAVVAAQDVLTGPGLQRVTDALHELVELLECAPKSRRWKLRAKVGERMAWYETPEELEHDHAPTPAAWNVD